MPATLVPSAPPGPGYTWDANTNRWVPPAQSGRPPQPGSGYTWDANINQWVPPAGQGGVLTQGPSLDIVTSVQPPKIPPIQTGDRSFLRTTYIDPSLARTAQYAAGNNPLLRTQANVATTALKTSTAADQMAMRGIASRTPTLTQGAKNSLTASATRDAGSNMSKLQGDLAINAQTMAKEANTELFNSATGLEREDQRIAEADRTFNQGVQNENQRIAEATRDFEESVRRYNTTNDINEKNAEKDVILSSGASLQTALFNNRSLTLTDIKANPQYIKYIETAYGTTNPDEVNAIIDTNYATYIDDNKDVFETLGRNAIIKASEDDESISSIFGPGITWDGKFDTPNNDIMESEVYSNIGKGIFGSRFNPADESKYPAVMKEIQKMWDDQNTPEPVKKVRDMIKTMNSIPQFRQFTDTPGFEDYMLDAIANESIVFDDDGNITITPGIMKPWETPKMWNNFYSWDGKDIDYAGVGKPPGTTSITFSGTGSKTGTKTYAELDAILAGLNDLELVTYATNPTTGVFDRELFLKNVADGKIDENGPVPTPEEEQQVNLYGSISPTVDYTLTSSASGMTTGNGLFTSQFEVLKDLSIFKDGVVGGNIYTEDKDGKIVLYTGNITPQKLITQLGVIGGASSLTSGRVMELVTGGHIKVDSNGNIIAIDRKAADELAIPSGTTSIPMGNKTVAIDRSRDTYTTSVGDAITNYGTFSKDIDYNNAEDFAKVVSNSPVINTNSPGDNGNNRGLFSSYPGTPGNTFVMNFTNNGGSTGLSGERVMVSLGNPGGTSEDYGILQKRGFYTYKMYDPKTGKFYQITTAFDTMGVPGENGRQGKWESTTEYQPSDVERAIVGLPASTPPPATGVITPRYDSFTSSNRYAPVGGLA